MLDHKQTPEPVNVCSRVDSKVKAANVPNMAATMVRIDNRPTLPSNTDVNRCILSLGAPGHIWYHTQLFSSFHMKSAVYQIFRICKINVPDKKITGFVIAKNQTMLNKLKKGINTINLFRWYSSDFVSRTIFKFSFRMRFFYSKFLKKFDNIQQTSSKSGVMVKVWAEVPLENRFCA